MRRMSSRPSHHHLLEFSQKNVGCLPVPSFSSILVEQDSRLGLVRALNQMRSAGFWIFMCHKFFNCNYYFMNLIRKMSEYYSAEDF